MTHVHEGSLADQPIIFFEKKVPGSGYSQKNTVLSILSMHVSKTILLLALLATATTSSNHEMAPGGDHYEMTEEEEDEVLYVASLDNRQRVVFIFLHACCVSGECISDVEGLRA